MSFTTWFSICKSSTTSQGLTMRSRSGWATCRSRCSATVYADVLSSLPCSVYCTVPCSVYCSVPCTVCCTVLSLALFCVRYWSVSCSLCYAVLSTVLTPVLFSVTHRVVYYFVQAMEAVHANLRLKWDRVKLSPGHSEFSSRLLQFVVAFNSENK